MSQLGFVGVITIMAVGLVADAIDAVPIDLGPYLNAGAVTVLSALLWIIITKLWPKERREAEAARVAEEEAAKKERKEAREHTERVVGLAYDEFKEQSERQFTALNEHVSQAGKACPHIAREGE